MNKFIERPSGGVLKLRKREVKSKLQKKSCFIRFIRVSQAIEDSIELQIYSADNLNLLKYMMLDALSECGVESFKPDLRDDYRDALGVADNPKFIISNDKELNLTIAEVESPGYRIRHDNNYKIVVPAKVKIFKYQSEVTNQ